MSKVEVQKLPVVAPKKNLNGLLARVCLHYGYTLAEVRRLPYKDIVILIAELEKEKAREHYELVQISTAPHTDKGKGVKALLKYYKGIING